MSHTPGPWHWTDHISPHLSVYASDGNSAVKITEPFYKDGAGVAEANARLIAAAPDLLEVAKAYEQWEASLIMEDESWRNGLPTLTQAQYDRLMEIQTMRNKAIAKTKGA